MKKESTISNDNMQEYYELKKNKKSLFKEILSYLKNIIRKIFIYVNK